MASRDELLTDGQALSRGLLRGEIADDQMTDKGRLLVGLTRGEFGWDDLTPQAMTLLGVDRSWTDRALGAVSKTSGIVTEGLPAAGRAAARVFQQPTYGQRQMTAEPVLGGPPYQARSKLSPVPWLLGLGENLMRMPAALGAAAAELGPEKAKPLTEALASNAPFLGRAPFRALAGEVKGLVPRRALPTPPAAPEGISAGGVRAPLPSQPFAPVEMPPAIETGPSYGVSGLPARLSDVPRPLEVPRGPIQAPGETQRALPPRRFPMPTEWPPEPPVRPITPRAFQEPPTILPGRGIPPEVDLLIPKRPVRPEAPLVSQFEAAAKNAGLDLTIPRKSQTLQEQYAEAKTRVGGGEPAPLPEVPKSPAPPLALPSSVRPFMMPESSLPKVPPPTGLPPVLTLPPPKGVRPPEKAPVNRGHYYGSTIEPGTVNLGDPEEVRILIEGYGGISRKGLDYGVPKALLAPEGKGVLYDELVDEIATAQSRKPQDVERALMRTLGRYETTRDELKASGLFQEIRGGKPPEDVPIALDEWRGMGPTERKGTIEFFRAEARGAADEPGGFGGILPPVPLPGPSEEDEGTAQGILQRAAQVAGLSLPLLGMAGLRWKIGGSKRALNAFKSEDQRFVVEQVSPDKWRVADMTTKERTVVPTFQAARQWAEQRAGATQATPTSTFERTTMGDQSLVPGTPSREMPSGKVQAEVPQKPVSETPLFKLPESVSPETMNLFDESGKFIPGAEVFGKKGEGVPGAPPPVPAAYRRESVGAGPGRGGQPPASQKAPAAEPGPLPEIPDSALGSGWRGVKRATAYTFSPVLSRFEAMGNAGRETSATIQRAESQHYRTYGQYAEPVVRQLETLSPAEAENFRLVTEGGARPMSPKVQSAYDAYQGLMGPNGIITQETRKRNLVIMESGGQARPFEPLQNFFPHEFSPEYARDVIRPGSPRRGQAIDHLMNTGQATSRDDAAIMLDTHFGARMTTIGDRIFLLDPDRFVGGLERAREINLPGYIQDPATAVAIRSWKAFRRFAELDHYGRLDATIGSPGGFLDPHTNQHVPAHGLIGRIQREAGYQEAAKAHHLFQQVLGRAPEEGWLRDLANKVTSVEALTKLPLAVIANMSQFAQVGARTNLSTMARGLAASVGRGGSQAAHDLGVLSDLSLKEFYAELAGKSLSRTNEFVLTPFNAAERFNRIMASNAGKAWAETIQGQLGQGPNPWLQREFTRLNFAPEEINRILTSRALTAEDRARVAWSIVDQTQFVSKAARRSEFFNTPTGAMIGQFKTFATNAGRLMNDVVIREARAGNYAPLARVAVLFPLVGELVEDVRMLVRGGERPDSLVARALENFFAVGGLGIATDFARTIGQQGVQGGLSFLAGPALADAVKVGDVALRGVMATEQGDELKMQDQLRRGERFAVRQVPYVGPGLAEAMRTDHEAEARARRTWQQRLGFDPAERQLRDVEAINRQAIQAQRHANELASEGQVDQAREFLSRFNQKHGTRLGISRESVRSRRRAEQNPEAERRRRLVPGVRGPLSGELPPIPEWADR